MSNIIVNNKSYEICQFYGEVVDTSKQRETQIHGAGGGGASYQGTGGTAPINISSTTVVHDQFFIVNEEGKELDVNLSNWNVSLRAGHKVQMLWVIPSNAKEGPFVRLNNLSLGKAQHNDDALKRVAKSHYIMLLWLSFLIAGIAGYMSSSIGFTLIIVFVAYIVYRYKSNDVFKQLDAAVDKEMI